MCHYDALPYDCRAFIQNLDYNLIEDHIVLGEIEIRRIMNLVSKGVQPTFYDTRRN